MKRLRIAGGTLCLGQKTLLMGILNVTPDSFSDGGLYCSPEAAARRAAELEAAGADLIDIGACSTRPGAVRADGAEELRRLRAVFDRVRAAVSAPISADTYRPEVARWALAHGAALINDVSGGVDPEMAAVVREAGAGWILTHAGGVNVPTESERGYPDGVLSDVQRFFDAVLTRTAALGVDPEQLCLDPGFGFAKSAAENVELLRGLKTLDTHGRPLLSALSRKRFVGALSGEAEAEGRLCGTLAANAMAVLSGAEILRVHDVAAHAPFVRALDGLKNGA